MKNIKIVKFLGGLGNQMFQYAFAKALEQKTGAKVFFDISSYKNAKKNIIKNTDFYKSGLSVRQYEMNIFNNADIEFADKFTTYVIKTSNILGLSKKYKEKNAFWYDENVYLDKHYRYFTGYYQNEKYFKSIRARLIKDFKLPEIREDDLYNKNLLNEINSCENPVFVHVRRGDYMSINCTLPDEYYRRAVSYIKERIANPTFFVFCAEDVDYINKEFDIGCDFKLIGEKNKTRDSFYENMRLMKACKHGILANSSYSWWAAWLNECNEKIIVAPSPWFKNCDEGMICDDWIKISSSI